MSAEDKKKIQTDVIRFTIELIVLIATVVLAYGAVKLDIAVLNEKMEHKVDDKQLFERLDKMKEDISKKIEDEISKIK